MKRSTVSPTYVPAADALTSAVGDEMVIMDLRSEKYFGLNRSGAIVWAGLEGGSPLSEIAARLAERFDVAAERAERDVADLVDELLRAGLVQATE